MENIYIVEGARTAFGTFGGSLKDIDATTLAVTASKAAIERSKIEPEDVDLTIIGNVLHSSNNSPYLARHVALRSGVPIEKPSLSVNRLCGSGLQSIFSRSFLAVRRRTGRIDGRNGKHGITPHVIRGTRFG